MEEPDELKPNAPKRFGEPLDEELEADDEEDFDVPEALTETLEGISAQLNKTPLAVEETEGDSTVTDDDLDALVDVPILELPEETTEVTAGDIDDIDVPILSPTDSVEIPSIVMPPAADIPPQERHTPSILTMVQETDDAAYFKPSLPLFKTLRALTESLPPEKRDVFRASRISTTLDAIIAYLSD